MIMPRVTIKDMLITTTLIAVGISMMWTQVPIDLDGTIDLRLAMRVAVWFFGGALIGAGVATPFKRPFMGAIVMIAIQAFAVYS
jgi:hypothetical protein